MYQMINERTLSHKRKTLHMRLLSNDCAAAAGMMNAFIVKDLPFALVSFCSVRDVELALHH